MNAQTQCGFYETIDYHFPVYTVCVSKTYQNILDPFLKFGNHPFLYFRNGFGPTI